MKTKIFLLALLLAGFLVPAQAQVKKNVQPDKRTQDSIDLVNLPQVLVYGKNSSQRATEMLMRKQLDRIQSANLGETLSKIPGIQNTYFGPNAGAPMIRSLTGNRVRVMQNGISLNDLSGISPGMNTEIDQDNLLGMEIYKASATVLFGGKAIGGAVDVRNNMIPTQTGGKKVTATVDLQGHTNSGFKQSFSVDGLLGKRLLWHVAGSNRWNNRIRIPGNSKPDLVYNPEYMINDSQLQGLAQVDVHKEQVLNRTLKPYLDQFVLDNFDDPEYGFSDGDQYTNNPTYYDSKSMSRKPNPKNPDYVPGQDPVKGLYKVTVKSIDDYVKTTKGLIPNSHSKSRGMNAGLNYLGETFAIGAGYQGISFYYGIPGYARMDMPAHTHTHADGEVHTFKPLGPYMPINVRQQSHMGVMKGEYFGSMPAIRAVRVNLQQQFSVNDEVLGAQLANRYRVNTLGSRIELEQRAWNGLTGSVGADIEKRRMLGAGKRRFLPSNASRNIGLFVMEHFRYKMLQADLGYRRELVKQRVIPDTTYVRGRGLAGRNLSTCHYGLNQFNAGLRAELFDMLTLKAQYNHSERAPEVNELYAGNVHFTIVTEENGDDQLKKEQANNVELGLEFKHAGLNASITAYRTYFKDYIYLAHTGVSRGSFTVKEWRNDNTLIKGLEIQLGYQHDFGTYGKWEFSSYYDLVKNINISDSSIRRWAEGDYMPNMPTSRAGFDLTGSISRFDINVAMDHYFPQKYIGQHIGSDPKLPGYSLLNARISYHFALYGIHSECYLMGNNLLNVEARPYNSPLKYLAPLPGINVGAGLRFKI